MVTCSFSTLTLLIFPLSYFLYCFLGLLSHILRPLTLKSLPSGLVPGEPRVKTASCTENSAWEIHAFRDLWSVLHVISKMISYPNINIFTQRNYRKEND